MRGEEDCLSLQRLYHSLLPIIFFGIRTQPWARLSQFSLDPINVRFSTTFFSEREIKSNHNMHLPRLLLLSLLSLTYLCLASPAGNLYVQKTLADYAFILDSGSLSGVQEFSSFDKVFTSDITFDFGSPIGIVQGLANVESTFRRQFPPGTVTQNVVTTESISQSKFDDQGSAFAAEARSYLTVTYFGQGHLTGQILTFYGRFEDTLIRTELQGNAGWRITNRTARFFVRPFLQSCLMPAIDYIDDVFINWLGAISEPPWWNWKSENSSPRGKLMVRISIITAVFKDGR